jgi:CotH kinase protein
VIHLSSRARWIVLIASSIALVALGLLVEARGMFPLLRFGMQRTPTLAPSTVVLPGAELRRGAPTVSLYLRPEDLYDRSRGILHHKLRHGREWERQAWISFFDEGKLVYAASAGVRVHGGGSRLTSPRQGFRLLFRRTYGVRELPAGVAFQGAHAHPVRRLVIHNDVRIDRDRPGRKRWYFANPLAYDITEAAGGIVAATRPVRFFLNGEFQGVYVLTEYFDADEYFKTHWGHPVRMDTAEFDQVWRQLWTLRPPRMRTVGRLVDLDNLTRWFIATVFCATSDPFQSPGQFRDPTRDAAQWFFVNWDMDQSFRDPSHDTFHAMLATEGVRRRRRATEPRSYLLTQLLASDPEYQEFFKRVWVDVMNHRLTPAFLDQRFEHYAKLAAELGVDDLSYLTPLKRFLQARPAVVRALAEKRLKSPPSIRVRIAGSGGQVTIDGHRVAAGWQGYYFPGMRVHLSIPDDARARFASWRVNGRDVGGPDVEIRADQDLAIETIWRSDDAPAREVPPPTQ